MKTIQQRNLPTDVQYQMVESYYNGGIEGAGECCQNCGRFIANVAVVESKYGRFHIGMDCAETLTGIKDSFDFEYQHKARFQQAKGARAAIQKHLKNGLTNLTLKTFTDDQNFYKEVGAGKWELEVRQGGHIWKQFPAETWGKYVLPMIQHLAQPETVNQ